MTFELFGLPPIEDVLPDRIETMHKVFGKNDGNKCGDCIYFVRYKQGSRWSKCSLTVQTGGTGTDWRATWPACGRFVSKDE